MHNNLLIMKLTGQTSKVASYNLILSDGSSTFKIENINNNKTEGFLDAIGGNKITYTKGSETKTWNYTGYDKNTIYAYYYFTIVLHGYGNLFAY